MKILAITTSSNVCSVALLDDLKVIIENHITDTKTHSQKLMPLIDTILKSQNITINDIDLFACSIGPGSFTGVRIAVSTVKAFADVTNKPVVSVSSLEGLAHNVNKSYFKDETDLVCSLIDAKNDNVYFGLFEKFNDEKFDDKKFDDKTSTKENENHYRPIENVKAFNINQMIEYLDKKYSSRPIIFVGDGSVSYKYNILEKLPKSIFVMEALNSENSISIGKCAYYKYKQGLYGDSNSVTPLYLRKSQAERALEGEK